MPSTSSVISENIQEKFHIYCSIRFFAYNLNWAMDARVLFPIVRWSGCIYVKGFYNLMSVFDLKIDCCKTFRKTTENP